jgi:hypothetical protein
MTSEMSVKKLEEMKRTITNRAKEVKCSLSQKEKIDVEGAAATLGTVPGHKSNGGTLFLGGVNATQLMLQLDYGRRW